MRGYPCARVCLCVLGVALTPSCFPSCLVRISSKDEGSPAPAPIPAAVHHPLNDRWIRTRQRDPRPQTSQSPLFNYALFSSSLCRGAEETAEEITLLQPIPSVYKSDLTCSLPLSFQRHSETEQEWRCVLVVCCSLFPPPPLLRFLCSLDHFWMWKTRLV